MSVKLILAIVTITTALICYSIGVWTEHHQKCLKSLAKKQDDQQKVFHRFSVLVWCIWLIPFVIGMMMGMS